MLSNQGRTIHWVIIGFNVIIVIVLRFLLVKLLFVNQVPKLIFYALILWNNYIISVYNKAILTFLSHLSNYYIKHVYNINVIC